MLNVYKVKKDFPILQKKMNGQPLIYLDNAATTQKPLLVIKTLQKFYQESNANIHRGIYHLSEKATALYEEAREKVRKFIGAKSKEEIIFTRGTTESINLVAYSWGRKNIKAGDQILITEMEHHSNIIPWQLLAKEKKAQLKFVPIDNNGRLKLLALKNLLTRKTRLLALTHVSNVLGTINPLMAIIPLAQKMGIKVLVDGAQAVPHLPVNVSKLNCDFYAFSGHKMMGPTGIGVLFAKKEILEEMPPFLTGGDMIKEVNKEYATWNDLPYKFEAGTMPLAEAVALGAAVDYLEKIGLANIVKYEQAITVYALKKFKTISGMTIYGPKEAKDKGGIITFNVQGVHPHDLASVLDKEGIAIRAGHHCAQPLLRCLGIKAAARASFYLYTQKSDIDKLVEAINKAKKIFL